MKTHTFVVHLGAGQGDVLLNEEMREWERQGRLRGVVFNGDVQERVGRSVAACRPNTWRGEVSGLIFTSPYPYSREDFRGKTVAEAMGQLAHRLFRDFESSEFPKPSIIVNTEVGPGGLTKEIVWAYEKALKCIGRDADARLEFVTTSAQSVLIPHILRFTRNIRHFEVLPTPLES